jgi:Na+-driven multidrug efflux pump
MKAKIIGLLKLALPAMISSFSGLMTILVCTRILGQADVNNYYLLAVFLPINYLMIALYESIRAASLVLSSVDAYQGRMNKISLNMASLIVALLIIFIVFLSLFLFFGQWLSPLIGVIPAEQQTFIAFSSAMLACGIVIGMAYIFTSTFFAMRKPFIGMSMAVISALLTCFLTYYFSQFISPIWLSYVLGSLIACAFCSVVSLVLMRQYGIYLFHEGFHQLDLTIKNLRPIMKVGFPVLFSCLAIFSSLFFINATLSHFNPNILTGYSIAYRIQNVAILPAITIGTAIAILSSNARVDGDKKEENHIQWIGICFCFLLYVFIAGAIYYFRENVMALVTSDIQLINSGATYLKTIALTYVFMGPNLAYLTSLEQSGFGLKSFFINILYFLIAVNLGCILAIHYQHYEYLYIALASSNLLVFIYVLVSLFIGSKLKVTNQSNLIGA